MWNSFYLTPWFWLSVAIFALIIEALSAFSLTTIWFALSAIIMIAVASIAEIYSVTIPIKWQWGIFLSISLLTLIFTRPFAIKRLKVGHIKTNADSFIGSEALVIRDIPKFGRGEVKIGGQIWSAKSKNQTQIPSGQICTVLEIQGVTLIVHSPESPTQTQTNTI
jgi:membrane protein implicated in regulation of membrane protease activity